MPDFPFSLGQGSLDAARAALVSRQWQLNGQIDAAGAPPGIPGAMPAPPVQAPDGRMITGQALMAGAQALGPRPTVTPQQQAQLVQMLKARMAQQQQQQPQQPPQQPAPGMPPMMQNAAPIPGMPQQ